MSESNNGIKTYGSDILLIPNRQYVRGKKWARRLIASAKPGCTVKEFKSMWGDMGYWFDTIQGTDLELASIILFSKNENKTK